MEAELCPVDNRRSVAEILLKLAVVHFTTITAYCHLLNIRGEPKRVICRKTILFFICPSSIIIQHILALLILASVSVLIQFTNINKVTPLQASLKRAPIILFGKVDNQSYPSQSTLHSSDKRSMIQTIGRVTVVSALAAQCIGSCIVFTHRYKHDAATLSDWRVFELAIAALLISLLTLVYLLWEATLQLSSHDAFDLSQRPFSAWLNVPHRRHRTYLDTTLFYLRDVPAPTGTYSHETTRRKLQRESLRTVFDAPTIISLFCTHPWRARRLLFSALRLFIHGGLIEAPDMFGCAECAVRSGNKHLVAFCQAVFFVTTVSMSAVMVLPAPANTFREWKRIGWSQTLLQILVLLILGLISWGLFALVYLLAFVLVLPSFTVTSLASDLVQQLKTLATWPTDLKCPLLWSDPKANFLWHLM